MRGQPEKSVTSHKDCRLEWSGYTKPKYFLMIADAIHSTEGKIAKLDEILKFIETKYSKVLGSHTKFVRVIGNLNNRVP